MLSTKQQKPVAESDVLAVFLKLLDDAEHEVDCVCDDPTAAAKAVRNLGRLLTDDHARDEHFCDCGAGYYFVLENFADTLSAWADLAELEAKQRVKVRNLFDLLREEFGYEAPQ